MPYISRGVLKLALDALRKHYSPLLTVSVPCMLASKVPVCTMKEASAKAVPFGGRDEKRWLDQFFRFKGGPPNKPFYMPGTGEWVEERYPERSLQRRRKDFEGEAFFHPDTSRWAFRQTAAGVFKDRVLKETPQIPLVALMAWMWRDREIADLGSALKQFQDEYGFSESQNALKLVGTVYSDAIPKEFHDAGLSQAQLTRDEIAELIGARPASPVIGDLAVAITALEKSVADAHFIAPAGLVARIVGGWLVGDIVVLVGQTGTGKTTLSRALSQGLKKQFADGSFFSTFIEIAPDIDSAQFLGYENLAGEFTAGRFAKEVLFVGAISDPRLVVLDEWNLAQIDSYFAQILSVIESRQPLRLPGHINLKNLSEDEREDLVRAQPAIANGQIVMPDNILFLATCNSWMEEPETRLPISGPVKRRCRIIQMPNALAAAWTTDGQQGVIKVCDTLIRKELEEIETRANEGNSTLWDSHCLKRIQAIGAFDKLQGETRGILLQLCKLLLDNPVTRDSFTPSILHDVLFACIYTDEAKQLVALGEQIADKVLHQVRGEPKVLELISDLTKNLPNAAEILDLAKRMGAYAGERRIRPLL